MSYPGPPGVKSSAAQPPASLPARPPPSSFASTAGNATTKPAFAAFAPRSVAAATTFRTSSPAQYAAAPTSASYGAPASYQTPPTRYPAQPQYDNNSYSAAPQIRNPFVPPPDPSSSVGAASTYAPGYDPDYEAQVQQWQSAYTSRENGGNAPAAAPTAKPVGVQTAPPSAAPASRNESTNQPTDTTKTVQRSGGGTTWTDSTLLEWDPAHFRIFVGNLAGEVTDETLLKAFSQYPSVQKARVIREKRTTKSKGYGFVSFSNADDYFRAAREQNGKYVGSHPIVVKKAMTDVRPATQKQNKHKGKGGAGGHGKVQHGGVDKKPPKTKGGLKVLG